MNTAVKKAMELVENPDKLMMAIWSGDYYLDFFLLDEKPVKVKGRRYSLEDALIIAACCFTEEERKVVLDDVKDVLLTHIVEEILASNSDDDEDEGDATSK